MVSMRIFPVSEERLLLEPGDGCDLPPQWITIWCCSQSFCVGFVHLKLRNKVPGP